MADQTDVVSGAKDMGGTMRLGSYPARLTEGSLVSEIYGATSVTERHRHRYEVNNAYRSRLEAAGLHMSGTSPDSHLVEFVELDRAQHPYFVATQAHPEFKSRPTRPHPLFASFVRAALDYLESERLPMSSTDPVGPATDTADVELHQPVGAAAAR
jgi:CTP synthase